jgi:hypothetical protein
MPHDTSAIIEVINAYFDGLYAGDTERLASVFDPSARLYTVTDGALRETPRSDWLAAVKARPAPSASNLPRTDRIVAIDVCDGVVACAKLECSIHPRYFVDYLTLLKTSAGWRIVCKGFRSELRGS